MNIDYNKIIEIHGDEYIYLIKENIKEVKLNIKYLYTLGFTDVEDIFERYIEIFITDNKIFKENINKLISKLGIDYVSIIENDLSLLEELL